MSQELQAAYTRGDWKINKLPTLLVGDLTAATISATAVSPIITAIDKAVVESTASSSQTLLSNLKSNILLSLRHPRLFFVAKPFFCVWTLYAATYATANSVESIAKTVIAKSDQVLISSITFLSTCVINVPLGVWKDIRFVQIYGRPTVPTAAISTKGQQQPSAYSKQKHSLQVQKARFPRLVGSTFLVRDAITIFGSINLPPILNSMTPSSLFSSPAIQMAVIQMFTPVFSQIFATPVHLLGLDLYSNPQSTNGQRVSRIKGSLGPVTAMRCSRIIPAFGVGLVLNTGLRDYLHQVVG